MVTNADSLHSSTQKSNPVWLIRRGWNSVLHGLPQLWVLLPTEHTL